MSGMQRLDRVLHLVMGVLEADKSRFALRAWAWNRQNTFCSSLADHFLEERQVPINQKLAKEMSERLELATDCLKNEDDLREEEVEAAEMLAWILQAIRTNRLDVCRDAWYRMLGNLDTANMRLALLNWIARWKAHGGHK